MDIKAKIDPLKNRINLLKIRIGIGNFRKLLVLFITLFLVISIPVGVYLVRQQTSLRSDAANPSAPAVAAGIIAKESTLKILSNVSEAEKLAEVIKRKQAMSELLEKDTSEFLKLALSEEVKKTLPQVVAEQTEKSVEIEGELQNTHFDNFEAKESRSEFHIKTSSGERKRLFFAEDKPEFVSTGTRIKINGVELGGKVAVQSAKESSINKSFTVLAKAITSQGFLPGPVPGPRAPREPAVNKKIAVILFNFQDNVTQPWTLEQIRDWTFGTTGKTVRNYFNETSFSNTIIGGDVFGWETVPFNGNTCPFYEASLFVKNKLESTGVGFASYSNIIYAFPTSPCFGALGWAELHGKELWINGSYNLGNLQVSTPGVVIHELGHNYGAHHANGYLCLDSSNKRVSVEQDAATICNSLEYLDPYDVMGKNVEFPRHMNNYHKGRLGWYPSKTNTQDILANGTYTVDLYPIERKTAQSQSLRISRKIDPISKIISEYYYVEYRRSLGLFDNFTEDVSAPNRNIDGVFIRFAPDYTKVIQSNLVDTTPDDDYNNAVLKVGKSFEDVYRGVKVTLRSADETKAVVVVTKSTPPCVRVKPSVFVSPLVKWGKPGDTLIYSLEIKNNDSPYCSSNKFITTHILPPGWVQNTVSPITLAPGQTGRAELRITSSSSSLIAIHTASQLIVPSSGSNYSVYAFPQYNVFKSDTNSPIIKLLEPKDTNIVVDSNSPPKHVLFEFEITDDTAIEWAGVSLNDSLGVIGWNHGPYSFYYNFDKVAAGKNTFNVNALDVAGNSTTLDVEINVIKITSTPTPTAKPTPPPTSTPTSSPLPTPPPPTPKPSP